MKREDHEQYLKLKRDFMPTIHSIVVLGYWTIRKANWISITRLACVLLGLQILTNAMQLHSFALVVLSVVFILIGTKLIK